MITIRSLLQYCWLAILVAQASAISQSHDSLQDRRGLVRDAPLRRAGGGTEEGSVDASRYVDVARRDYNNANQNGNQPNPSQSANPNSPGDNNGGKGNPNMDMSNGPAANSKDNSGGGQVTTKYMTVTKTVTKQGKCPPPMMTGCPPPVLALTNCPLRESTLILTTTVGANNYNNNNNCQFGKGMETVSTVTKIKKVTAIQTSVQTQTMALAACPPPVIEVTTVPGLCAPPPPPASTTQENLVTTTSSNNQILTTSQAIDSSSAPPQVDQFGNLIGTSSSLQIGGDINLLTAAPSKRQVNTPAIEIVTGSPANGAEVTPGLPLFSELPSSASVQSLSPSLGNGNFNPFVGVQQQQGQVSCPATITITATQPCAVTTTIGSCNSNGLGSNNNGGLGSISSISSPTGLSVVAVSTGSGLGSGLGSSNGSNGNGNGNSNSNSNNNAAVQTAGCFLTNDPNFRPGMATIPMSIATQLGNQIMAETATGGATAQITSSSGGSLQTTAASVILLSGGPGGMLSTATVCSVAPTGVPIGLQTLPKPSGNTGVPGSRKQRRRIVG